MRDNIINIEEYKYKYETHLHTMEASACAKNTSVEMVKACKEAGYAGCFITNHAWGGNTSVNRSLSWEDWVEKFCECYYPAKEWGDNNDFDVFFGYESGYEGTEFLIYGVTPEYLKATKEFKEASIERQYELVKKVDGIVIQAHPFRDEFYIPLIRVYSKFIDGIEGVNATHSSHLSMAHNVKEWNDQAIAHANRHELPMTAGSDVHTTMMFGGGMIFKNRIKTVDEFKAAVLSDEMYLLTDGDHVYDRYGNFIK